MNPIKKAFRFLINSLSFFSKILILVVVLVIIPCYFVLKSLLGDKLNNIGLILVGISVVIFVVSLVVFMNTGSSPQPQRQTPAVTTPPATNRRQGISWGRIILGIVLIIISAVAVITLVSKLQGTSTTTMKPKVEWVLEWQKPLNVKGLDPEQRRGGPYPLKFLSKNSERIDFFIYSNSGSKIGEYFLTNSLDTTWSWVGYYNDPINLNCGDVRLRELSDGSFVGDETTGIDSNWVYLLIRKR